MMNSTVRSVLEGKNDLRVWTVLESDLVYSAIKLMAQKNIGALLVMSGGKVTGIITERDYSRRVALEARSSFSTTVREVMTPEVCIVSPDDTVDYCLNEMSEKRIRHLLVMENGDLHGLISMGDVVNTMLRDREFEIHQLTAYISGAAA